MIIMMIFNISTSYFHKISFHYFEDYLMIKLTLGVRYFNTNTWPVQKSFQYGNQLNGFYFWFCSEGFFDLIIIASRLYKFRQANHWTGFVLKISTHTFIIYILILSFFFQNYFQIKILLQLLALLVWRITKSLPGSRINK
jgi:hypothetical protein